MFSYDPYHSRVQIRLTKSLRQNNASSKKILTELLWWQIFLNKSATEITAQWHSELLQLTTQFVNCHAEDPKHQL